MDVLPSSWANFICKPPPPNSSNKILGCCLFLKILAYSLSGYVFVRFLLVCWNYNQPYLTADTNYLNWVSQLPSISVCPVPNRKLVQSALARISPQNNNNSVLVKCAVALLKPNYKLNEECDLLNNEYSVASLASSILPSCENIMDDCKWNDRRFGCCRFFQQVKTSHGICFTMNSRHNRDSDTVPFEMVTSFFSPEAKTEIKLRNNVKIFVHDQLDLDFQSHTNIKTIKLGMIGEIFYKFTDVSEDVSTWSLTAKQRDCLLEGESKNYSQSTCLLDCKVRQQIKKCGCVHYLLPRQNNEPVCDVHGLKCIEVFKGGEKEFEQQVKECNCLQQCSYTEVDYVRYSVTKSSTISDQSSSATIKLTTPPSVRIKMYAKTTVVDIIVAVCCFTRLFTNASLSQIVIDIYYIFLSVVYGVHTIFCTLIKNKYHSE